MLFDRVKFEHFEVIEKDKTVRYGFRFSKNKAIYKLFTSDNAVFQRFKNEFKRRCILNSFQEDFHIEKLIGTGSFGKVYLIRRKENNQKFAAKMFFKDSILKQKKGRESLLNEIRILMSLDHPGIMKLYEVHESMLSVFLIIELLEGGELLERLDERKSYSENDCIQILKKIIEPLAYMHTKGIMHRDIKPENLILRSKKDDFDIVIADFGLAQEIDNKIIYLRCGTPGYCAPEILSSKGNKLEYSLKCDVFSVGCVFYSIIAGRSPFSAQLQKDVYSQNKSCDVDFDESKLQLLSPAAQDLLQRMLAKDSASRLSFEECLSHRFFTEKEKNTHVMFYFTRQSDSFEPKVNKEKTGEKGNYTDNIKIGSYEDSHSFIIGRSNIIKGTTETVQELGIVEQLKNYQPGRNQDQRTNPIIKIKTNNSLLSPLAKKQNVSAQKMSDVQRELKEELYSKTNSLNADSDSGDENIQIEKREPLAEMGRRVKRLTYTGTIRNPFVEQSGREEGTEERH